MTEAAMNTDTEIWRRTLGDYYSDSVFVTAEGAIGINSKGRVIVMEAEDWVGIIEDATDDMLSLANRKRDSSRRSKPVSPKHP